MTFQSQPELQKFSNRDHGLILLGKFWGRSIWERIQGLTFWQKDVTIALVVCAKNSLKLSVLSSKIARDSVHAPTTVYIVPPFAKTRHFQIGLFMRPFRQYFQYPTFELFTAVEHVRERTGPCNTWFDCSVTDGGHVRLVGHSRRWRTTQR